jgi:hypothetical protein
MVIIANIYGCDCRRDLDWWVDLLTLSYTYNSEPHLLTAASLSPHFIIAVAHAKPQSFIVLHSRCLVTDLNNWDSSSSVLTSLLSGKYPTTELSITSSPQLTSRQFHGTDHVENTVHSHTLIVSAGICSRHPEMGCVIPFIKNQPTQ